MLSAKKYRLPIHNLVLRPMIKCLSRKYFGHVNKPSTAASASHRHYVGFPNYVLTYLLTYLLTTRQQSGFRFYEAETTKNSESLRGIEPTASQISVGRSSHYYDAFNVANPSSMQDMSHMNLKMAKLTQSLS